MFVQRLQKRTIHYKFTLKSKYIINKEHTITNKTSNKCLMQQNNETVQNSFELCPTFADNGNFAEADLTILH